jgi:hypothetical protein
MLLRLHLSLLVLWIAGCATERLLVPEEDWQTVPAAQRASIDRRHAADLAAARAELTSATTELAAFRRAHPGPLAPPPSGGVAPRPAPAGDGWDNAVRDHEQARRAAFARVETDKATWLRTDLAWRELRAETASARLELVICEREIVRARTIDHNLLGTESYDSAPVRGQFSRAQQRWYGLANRAGQARDAFERASRSLASSKEEYAQLMRNGPAQLRSQPAYADDRPARLELTAWAVLRSDIRRRRGLRHFLDDAANAPAGLRRAKIQLAARTVVLPRPPADVAANDPPVATPGSVKPEPAKPSLAAEPTRPSAKPAAVSAAATAATPAPAKPAPAKPAAPTPATAPKTATAAPLAPAPSKPAALTPPTAPVAPKTATTATAPPLAPVANKPAAPKPAPASPMFPPPASQSTPTSAAKLAEPSDPSSR